MMMMMNLLIEIDSINWYGTEYWLSVFEGFKLIHHEFLLDNMNSRRRMKRKFRKVTEQKWEKKGRKVNW